jgi:hypothetical protein
VDGSQSGGRAEDESSATTRNEGRGSRGASSTRSLFTSLSVCHGGGSRLFCSSPAQVLKPTLHSLAFKHFDQSSALALSALLP